MFEFVFTSLIFLDNNALSQPVVFSFSCCTQYCYFIADEVRAIPNGIFYLFEIGLLRFFVIVCFKTAFARVEMKR